MNVGIADQRRKIRRLEEAFRLGVDRIERFLRQRVAQLAGATRQRGQRRRAKDRDANIGEPVWSRRAACAARRSGDAAAPASPASVRPAASASSNAATMESLRRQIQHGIAELARPLPGEIRFAGSISTGFQQQHVGVEPQTGAPRHQPHPEEIAELQRGPVAPDAVGSGRPEFFGRMHAAGSLRPRHCRRHRAIPPADRNCRR